MTAQHPDRPPAPRAEELGGRGGCGGPAVVIGIAVIAAIWIGAFLACGASA